MNLETASEISGSLSGGLQVHHYQFTHTPVLIKTQEANHNILGSPTQMCDAAKNKTFNYFRLLRVISNEKETKYLRDGE
jgi:hypothetical protein